MISRVEQVRRAYDDFHVHRMFAEETLHVREKSGKLIPYRFAPSQIKFNESIDRQVNAGKPVRQCWLKSRQVYGSTTVAARYFQDLAFRTGIHARIIAHETEAAGDIFDYYKTFCDSYEPFRGLIAASPLSSDTQRWLKWQNDSWARIMTAGNIRSGRSATVQRWHCSEMAFWPNATQIFRGIQGSVPSSPDTAVIIESTANGIGNEFHQLCLLAMSGDSDWGFVFFGWHEHPEYFRVFADDRQIVAFERSLTTEERALAERFDLSLEQLNWRRNKIGTDFKGDIDGFRQEFPADPEEAFISSGRPRFSLIDLRAMPIIDAPEVGELTERQIGPQRFISFEPRERGAMTVYRRPERGHAYVIGADTSEGIDAAGGRGSNDPDWSVACVLDVSSGEQVAKFRARIHPSEFGRILATLGAYYNWAFTVVEVNNTGLATVAELQRLAYPGELLYRRSNNAPGAVEKTATTHKWGWQTNTVTRQQLIGAIDSAILERSITVRDAHTLAELMTFVISPTGKPQAQSGCHDDEVFALGLAIVGIQNFPAHLLRRAQPLAPTKYNQPSGERKFRVRM